MDIIICGKNIVDVSKLLKTLSKKGIKKILLEGGGNLNWTFFKQNIIDEVIVTVTPYILGGKDSISLVEGTGFKHLASSKKLVLKKIKRNRNELVLFYRFNS